MEVTETTKRNIDYKTIHRHSKNLINHLLVADDQINDYEQILDILGEMDQNYTSLITTITSKKRVFPLDKVFTRM